MRRSQASVPDASHFRPTSRLWESHKRAVWPIESRPSGAYNIFMVQKLFLLLIAFGFVSLVAYLASEVRGNALFAREVVIAGTAVPPPPPLDQEQIAQGEGLYLQHCANCHGVDRQGAENWKVSGLDGRLPPPPHDDSGHTWHHPDFQLVEIIRTGGAPLYDGVMPGFAERLARHEIDAILEYLKSEWGREAREYQWWITSTYPTPTANQ